MDETIGNPLWYWLFKAYARRPNTGARWRALPVWFLAGLLSLLPPAFSQTSQPLKKVGILYAIDEKSSQPWLAAIKEGLRGMGWIEGKNIQFIARYADDDASRFAILAKEVVALKVDVIFVTDPMVPAARSATATIPIVCPDFFDPVAEGVATTLAKPTGNVTGLSWQSIDSAAKRLELTKEAIPAMRNVGLLLDASDPAVALEVKAVAGHARKLGLTLKTFEVRGRRDFVSAFALIKRDRPDALIVSHNPLTFNSRDQIARFSLANSIPMVSEGSEFADAGGLLTYGVVGLDTYRRAAIHVDKILKGAKPNELPIEQPTLFELAVNKKTAQALRVKLPETIMVRATKVIR